MIKYIRQILFLMLALAISSQLFAQLPMKFTPGAELKPSDNMIVTKAGERMLIPDTKISLIPPEHYMFSKDLKSFIHPTTSSSIQISEIIGTSYIMVSKGLSPEYLLEQGFVFKEKLDIKTNNGYDGYLYILGFSNKGVDYERLMLLAGDYHNTIWANVSYPFVSKKYLFEPLKESLLTAQFTK
ncbi:MAG: hypothetical protein GX879_08820 [Bacteroidales bacterium]|nr:hypothetical protein [Bacteroidales bacterium]